MSKFVCYSGGCAGADIAWEEIGYEYGVDTIAYSFKDHHQYSKNPHILSVDELLEGWDNIKKAESSLDRNLTNIEHNPYVRNLLCRNWFQVKNSDAIFAVGTLQNTKMVNGGTGWAAQMAIDNDKPVYLYDQSLDHWMVYLTPENCFTRYYDTPTLTRHFAGIGTRQLTPKGKLAIEEVYKHTMIQFPNLLEHQNE